MHVLDQHLSDGTSTARIAAILTASFHSWQQARLHGSPIQPAVFRALEAHDCVMLAPVLDSLFHFYEAALDRPLDHEADVQQLVDLLGRRCDLANVCAGRKALGLNCALCSTRIMLALAMPKTLQ